jgi:hypothetical protein
MFLTIRPTHGIKNLKYINFYFFDKNNVKLLFYFLENHNNKFVK